jgi:hypothetical protein
MYESFHISNLRYRTEDCHPVSEIFGAGSAYMLSLMYMKPLEKPYVILFLGNCGTGNYDV